MKLFSDQSVLPLSGSDQLRQGSVRQHGGQWDVASLFVHRGSLLLCVASAWPGSLSLSEQVPPLVCLSVCQVLLCCETLAVNCLCFLSFLTSLNITHFFFHLYICSFLLSSALHLHLFRPLIPPLCHPYPSDSNISTPSLLLPPAFAVLWRPTEAIRTDGLRWFPGSTHCYRKQPGTAAGMMLSQGVCRSNFTLAQSSNLNSEC